MGDLTSRREVDVVLCLFPFAFSVSPPARTCVFLSPIWNTEDSRLYSIHLSIYLYLALSIYVYVWISVCLMYRLSVYWRVCVWGGG